MTDASVLSNTNIALQISETVLRKFKKILYRGSCIQSAWRGVGQAKVRAKAKAKSFVNMTGTLVPARGL